MVPLAFLIKGHNLGGFLFGKKKKKNFPGKDAFKWKTTVSVDKSLHMITRAAAVVANPSVFHMSISCRLLFLKHVFLYQFKVNERLKNILWIPEISKMN